MGGEGKENQKINRKRKKRRKNVQLYAKRGRGGNKRAKKERWTNPQHAKKRSWGRGFFREKIGKTRLASKREGWKETYQHCGPEGKTLLKTFGQPEGKKLEKKNKRTTYPGIGWGE